MATMTLALPDTMKQRIDEHPEINWSEIARQAILKKIDELAFVKEFTRDSTMTEEDAEKLGRQLNKKVAKRYLALAGIKTNPFK